MSKSNEKTMRESTKNRIILGAASVLVLAILAFGVKYIAALYAEKTTTEAPSSAARQTTQAQPAGNINPLTGLYGLSSRAAGKRPVAVVVENSPSARPQWGLCSPDIVIEGMVEGGMTRMLWLYADGETIPKVGPMRSARHDFVEIAEGFDAVYIHWGWSIYAKNAITSRHVDHIDGNADNGNYFFRDKTRSAPHNGYTRGASIVKDINRLNINTRLDPDYASPFLFAAEGSTAVPTGNSCNSVSFMFSQDYKHEFRYDTQKNLYYNYMNSKPMKESGGKQMAVTNVIILYCPVSLMGDKKGCIDMDLSSGKGLYVSQGKTQEITWAKGGPDNMLRLHTTEGEKKLTLNPGKSYIGFVPVAEKSRTVIKGAPEATTVY